MLGYEVEKQKLGWKEKGGVQMRRRSVWNWICGSSDILHTKCRWILGRGSRHFESFGLAGFRGLQVAWNVGSLSRERIKNQFLLILLR